MEENTSARKDRSFQASSSNSESSSDYESSTPTSASTSHSSSMDLEKKISNLRQINTFPRNKKSQVKAKQKSNSHGLVKSGKVLKKTNSMRPVRILTKMVSLRSRKPSSNASKATCSSTFKNSQFPKDTDFHQVGESEGLSAMKPCTYSYCSLHGHHRDPAPPLKRFVSIRRRALRSQRSIKPKIRPPVKSKNLGDAKRVMKVNKIGNGSIFIDNHCDIAEDPLPELEEVGSCDIESKGEKSDADDFAISNVSASVRERLSDRLLQGLPPLGISARNRTMEKDTFISMWSLLHKSVSSGKVSTQLHSNGDNNQENISGQDIVNKNLDLGNEKIERDAIKLVEAAIDEILSPEVEDQISDVVSTTNDLNSNLQEINTNKDILVDQEKALVKADNITTTTEEKKTMQPSPKNWSKLKKVILFRRFIKALDKVRNLNFMEPHYLPLEADHEAESVSLRRQTSEERKRVEEWMLDYALRQVVSNLTPTRRRKVELLVEAFETVIPAGNGPRLNLKPHVFPLAKTKSGLINIETQATDTDGKEDKIIAAKLDALATDNYSSSVPSHSQGPNLKPNVFPLAKTKLDLMNLDTQATDTTEKNGKINESGSVHSHSQGPILREESLQKPHDIFFTSSLQDNPVDGMVFQEVDNKNTSREKTISLQIDDGSNNEDTERECESKEGNKESEKFDQPSLSPEEVETGEPYKTQMEKQRYMKMWRVIYTQVVTGSAAKFGNDSNLVVREGEKSSDKDTMHQKIELNQIEAIKLVEKAIDEVILPENEEQSSDDISITNDIASDKFGQIKSKFGALRYEGPKDDVIITAQERIKERQNKWSNLKKLILLNRFVKALDKVREFNPRGPRFLPVEDEPEPENVKLRHQTTLERKKGEEWMIDNAIQQVVARLTPARKRRVELLVEAFETVTPLSDIGTTPTKQHGTGHRLWPMRSPREANHSGEKQPSTL